MATKAKNENTEITIIDVKTGIIDAYIVGTTPIILNTMSEKVRQELLMPKGKKNKAEKASLLKHDPLSEYRNSVYKLSDENRKTFIGIMSTAVKSALRNAALDLPGSTKSQIGRLTFVETGYIELFGIPKLFMSITRCADKNQTPDVRTRAIIDKWACKISIKFIEPLLKATTVVNLLAAAGITQGIGDWRPEKGKGDYGQFRICRPNDEEYKSIVKIGGRKAQIKALDFPECYDSETENLLSWFEKESQIRGHKTATLRVVGE